MNLKTGWKWGQDFPPPTQIILPFAVPNSSFFFPPCAAQLIQISTLSGMPNTVTHRSPGLSLTFFLLPISFTA